VGRVDNGGYNDGRFNMKAATTDGGGKILETVGGRMVMQGNR
jgi:hypothetical protein